MSPNDHSCASICDSTFDHDFDAQHDQHVSKIELDLHANMVVGGKHCTVISDSGKTARVKAFSPDCDTLENMRIVDMAVKWHHPCTDEMHILIVHNALHVPSMTNNLMPPFIMRKAGAVVNDTPKIHVEDPGVEKHTLWFPVQGEDAFAIDWNLLIFFH